MFDPELQQKWQDYLVQGGGCEGEINLTEADCSDWIRTLSRARHDIGVSLDREFPPVGKGMVKAVKVEISCSGLKLSSNVLK